MPPKHLLWCLLIGVQLLLGQENRFFTSNPIGVLPSHGSQPSIGYAGMLGGVNQGVLIAVGGANFPKGMPWEGGPKVWSDAIYIFVDDVWRVAGQKLNQPLAYGASVTLDSGILCIGGEDGKTTLDSVFLLSYDSESGTVTQTPWPALPEPLAYTAAAKHNGYVYVAGGKNDLSSVQSVYRIAIKSPTSWERLPDFPGLSRAVHALAIQEAREETKLYLIGGRSISKGKKSKPLASVVSYGITSGIWQHETPIQIDGQTQINMGASAMASGSMHIVLFGGSDEKLFNRLETLALKLPKVQNDSVKTQLLRQRDSLLVHHPGFSRDLLAYNTITQTWSKVQSMPTGLPVTGLLTQNKDRYYMISGEISPGVRSPKTWVWQTNYQTNSFGFWNYLVLALYLLVSLVIGVYFSKRQKSTTDYFAGGGRIPWWASGLSVFGTLLSAITFMAIPAKAFITDWSYFFLNMAAIAITPVVAYLFLPFFNKLNLRTAYQYLEDRFNYTARAFGSLAFILFQLGRIGIVLLLPSLAISIVSGIPVETSILIMGVLCILYTTFGGIEAVIWTDVLQVIVLMGGSILVVCLVVMDSGATVGEMWDLAQQKNKLNLLDFDFNFTDTTFWVVFIGGLASALITQGTDQTIVQRYLTSTDLKDSRKTLYTNAVLTLPASLLFFGLGSLLFLFYSEQPQALSPTLSNNDALLPWYIVQELPVGVAGLLIAGIFSAAMSSISSSLNSVATAYCNDFHSRFAHGVSDTQLLKVARYATVVTGILGLGLALWMAHSNIKSLWDQFYKYLGLFTGGLGGLFLLGMLTKRAHATGALFGLLCSALITWYVSAYTQIHLLMYALIGLVSCYIFGYVFSLIVPKTKN
ncbi:sodium transporter [Sediminicola luteus]|uniref:Sodium transporter n=2 Tax=Sediminicola luteus TaxID=319238 RepID=A0A2A4G4X2_9FLAO|nr:sodium transporter [Sediminicola luteus]